MKDIFSFPKCRMTHLSLFTGIGGLDLAAEWAGFETVGQCEWADYPTKVLEKHWPNVPRWRDIRELTGGSFFERTGCGTVDLISGGFPCQPFSFAGKRRGSGDDRYLWPEMLRVIKELRPRWVIGENVAGIVNMALDTVLSDLESIGYTTGEFIIPACAVDAPHRRDRCAIVANNDSERRDKFQYAGISEKSGQSGGRGYERNAPNSTSQQRYGSQPSAPPPRRPGPANGGRWPAKPGLGGMADGLPRWLDEPLDVPRIARGVKERVNRLKCLGNAVVPQQFYPVFRAIAEIERGGSCGNK